jgi:hypothetical protein
MIEILGFICLGLAVWLGILLAYLSDKFKDDRYDDM